jgi:hypothetical protein
MMPWKLVTGMRKKGKTAPYNVSEKGCSDSNECALLVIRMMVTVVEIVGKVTVSQHCRFGQVNREARSMYSAW